MSGFIKIEERPTVNLVQGEAWLHLGRNDYIFLCIDPGATELCGGIVHCEFGNNVVDQPEGVSHYSIELDPCKAEAIASLLLSDPRVKALHEKRRTDLGGE